MEEDCRTEIEELHRFFQAWFSAALPARGGAFSRLGTVLAPEFGLISPAGLRLDRRMVLKRLRAAHGSSGTRGQPARLWVKAVRVQNLSEGFALATYEEWQQVDGKDQGRLSSALFRQRESTPNGVEWVHLHEVWLPAGASSAAKS